MSDQTTTNEETEDADAAQEPQPTHRSDGPRVEDRAEAGGGGEQPDEDGLDGAEDEGLTKGRHARRSAHWRDRATTAEARAERLTHREVLRLLGERVSDPQAALILDGGNLADLLDQDGDVDPRAVAELAGRVTDSRPYLRIPGVNMDLGPKASLPQGRKATWGSMIKGK